jgi:hypothetical protein
MTAGTSPPDRPNARARLWCPRLRRRFSRLGRGSDLEPSGEGAGSARGQAQSAQLKRGGGSGEMAARKPTRAQKEQGPEATGPRSNEGSKRNGGRHCCQPPLRRAKDMPVFVTWSSENPKAPMNPLSILAHQLRRRFPPCRSLFRGARPIYLTAPPEGSLVFRLARPGCDRSPIQNRPMFHGPSWGNHSCVPLRSPNSEEPGSRVAQETIPSSGASSRLAPVRTRKFCPLPAGGDRTFGHLPHPRTVAGSWGGRDRRPDHLVTMHIASESRKQNLR